MTRFEETLRRPRSCRWLALASKISSVCVIPLIAFYIFAPSWTLRLWAGGLLAAAALFVVSDMFLRDLYASLAVLLTLSPFWVAVGSVALSQKKDFDPLHLLLTAPLVAAGIVGLLRWLPARREPIQSPQRNAGSRPSSGDSSASETPSSHGPRG